ncbi:WD40/YVTN/BNR-like repeat-containing protein [Micromonospora sp. 067-2]|uniref:WD40/YVTN/BNR-like repeat-containing protein n=1 Tax=Micromonospora sp. 067-2 TaxID=2789270 RepID=UPI00397B0664
MSGREFAGFDVASLTEAVRQPPFDDLRSAARSRRRRLVAVAVTAVVAVAGVALVPLVNGPERANPAPPGGPSPRPEHYDDFTSTGPGSGVDVHREGCLLRFFLTDDGGRSWSDGNAVRIQATRCQASSDPATANLTFSVLSDRSYLVNDAGLLRLSTDYGRTWQDGEQAITPVPSFPATARPAFCVFGVFGCGALREPLAVDPSSGAVYRLAGRAPSWRPLFGLYPSRDGTLWASYQMRLGSSAATVARSIDRGATWNTWEVVGASAMALVGLDDREAYLLTEQSAAGGLRLFRTTDGAKTWTDTGTDLPKDSYWDLTVGSDGSLLASSVGTGTGSDRSARILVSRDDGRHFTLAREYGLIVGSVSIAPGSAWLFGRSDGSTGEPDHIVLTTDATTWTRLTLAR